MEVFTISDHHFFHENIIKYCNRPFLNRYCMNYFMIKMWNSVVSKDDIVIHNGDFCLGKNYELMEITKELNGKIILIRGNHDRFSTKQYKDSGIFEIYKDDFIVDDICFIHRPIGDNQKFKYVIHGHIHANSHECTTLNHYNVSVEMINYTPIKLEDINPELKPYAEKIIDMYK